MYIYSLLCGKKYKFHKIVPKMKLLEPFIISFRLQLDPSRNHIISSTLAQRSSFLLLLFQKMHEQIHRLCRLKGIVPSLSKVKLGFVVIDEVTLLKRGQGRSKSYLHFGHIKSSISFCKIFKLDKILNTYVIFSKAQILIYGLCNHHYLLYIGIDCF